MCIYIYTYSSFLKQGDPNIDSKYFDPYYGDPQKGTPNFGKLHIHIYIYIYMYTHL